MMRLRNFRTFLALSATLLFVVYFALWTFSDKPVYSFKVTIIPLSGEDDRADGLYAESDYWFKMNYLFPKTEIPQPLPKGIPKSERLILVSFEKGRKIRIDSEQVEKLENTTPLTEKLNEIFRKREMNGVFEPKSQKILKAVIIKAPRSAKYGDVAKLIDAVKSSGADPIVLQIDDLD